MVASTGREDGKRIALDADALRFASDSRVRGRRAALEAKRISDVLMKSRSAAESMDEGALFRALHAAAYRASHGRRGGRLSASRRAKWALRWKTIRDAIVEANLGLVWSMISQFGPSSADRDELGSAGMMTLLKAVDAFNPWLGFRFSTYACNAIRRSLILVARNKARDRMVFPLEWSTYIERPEPGEEGFELFAERMNKALDENLGELSDREARVVASRFPLDGSPGRTLGQVGEAMGLSKERVRQIQKSALSKLRAVLEADPVLQ